MFKQVLIVEKSKIVSEGLKAVLTGLFPSIKVSVAGFVDECPLVLKGNNPDLVIFSPELLTDNMDRTRAKHKFDPQAIIVGIISHYCPKETIDMFDDSIFFTDSVDSIDEKLQYLYKFRRRFNMNSAKLTERERMVLRLLIHGYSNREVAEKLSISSHTVISHRKNIMEKTSIKSLAGLAAYAILNNIADMDDIK